MFIPVLAINMETGWKTCIHVPLSKMPKIVLGRHLLQTGQPCKEHAIGKYSTRTCSFLPGTSWFAEGADEYSCECLNSSSCKSLDALCKSMPSPVQQPQCSALGKNLDAQLCVRASMPCSMIPGSPCSPLSAQRLDND